MPNEVYLIIHIVGIVLVVQSLAIASYISINGESGTAQPGRRIVSISHGLGLFLIILGGFGMLAKLGIGFPWPGWLWVKLGIWIVFGVATVFIRRMPSFGRIWLVLITVLVLLAAVMAIVQPF